MKSSRRVHLQVNARWQALLVAALCALPLASCSQIQNGDGDSTTGTLSGTVSNSLTEAGLAGVTVMVEPEVEDASITTSADGTYSQELPTGVYTLTFEETETGYYESRTATVVVLTNETTVADAALTPTSPVFVNASLSGDAEPGATLTATATIDVLDGSTVQNVSWSQSNSVAVTISNATSQSATVRLPAEDVYKSELMHVLREPPVSQAQLPENVTLPEGEFPGGLQNRFHVVGINPFSLEETALVTLTVEVETTSGTYTQDVEIHTELPWKVTTGLRTVPIGVPVLLHARDHIDEDGDGVNDETGASTSSYNWSLSRPSGSGISLRGATTQNPYFIPDKIGVYTVTITDTTRAPGNEVITLEVHAGTWVGAISGRDENGLPESANCTVCHNGTIAPDNFTPWAQTGHAHIFSENLDTSTHYGPDCFSCHTVGYDEQVFNGGVDDTTQYDAFVDAGLLNNPGDNWTTVLEEFPTVAKLANVQCENCHGPQDGGAHTSGAPRISLSSDVCASCHGEPLRHARFQQWQLSGHANYEIAIDESQSGSCARCHTANGFLEWLPVLMDDDPATDPNANVAVGWTADEAHPQTCVTCHDPHESGSVSGEATDVTVRIHGNTPPLIAGFTVIGAGNGAICMTCHNSRRGLRNDENFEDTLAAGDGARAPHGSAQTDILMGENAYLVEVGIRGNHSLVQDTCVNCHMEQTPPPDLLAYNLGGTNHTFAASETICSNCHGPSFTASGIQNAFAANAEELEHMIEQSILDLMESLIAEGNTIDLGGEATVTDIDDIDDLVFGESHGGQAITVTMGNTTIGPVGLTSVMVSNQGSPAQLYAFADARLMKAGWNLALVSNDGSQGVHNPAFVFEILDASIDALEELESE